MADEKIPAPRSPAPAIHPVHVFPTPDKRDILFYVEVDSRLPKYAPGTWTYGDLITGKPKADYPSHRLIYVSPQTEDNWERRWYAKDRADEDNYNYTVDGDQVLRFYVVLRALYYQRTEAEAAAANPVVPGEFTVPEVATPDVRFGDYGFADDSLVELPEDLRSLYVGIQRRYVVPVQTSTLYDNDLERNVDVTREIIAKGAAIGSSSAGIQIEREYGNNFHDWKVTSTLLLGEDEEYPLQLTSLIADVPYRFPAWLQGARMIAAWALADSEEAAMSYDEAWYIKWDLVDPVVGPYEARIRRYVTNNPNALRSQFPIVKFVTKREAIGITRAWAIGSNKGNSSYAEAREIEVPPSVHGEIEIENGETLSAGQSTNHLEATPRFSEVSGQASLIVGYEPKQARYGLYIVEIIEINCTGVYDGVVTPFGTLAGPGALPPSMGADVPPEADERPETPSGEFSDDNSTVSGRTSPNAEVRATIGTSIIGRGVANTDGSYSFTIEGTYTDATSVTLTAYLDGLASAPTTISTLDLSPGRPSGYLYADMTTVQGETEPGATVTIIKDAVAQVETVTIPEFYPQVETATLVGNILTDGTMKLTITSALVTGSPLDVFVDVLNGDTATVCAQKGADELNATAAVAQHYLIEASGPDIVLTALVSTADDATLNLASDNGTCTGLTPDATSADTTPGGSSPMAISTAGTVIVTVTSGLASATWSPVNVPVWVEVGDDATDVAAKVAAALALSVVDDEYTANASTNTVALTSNDVAANDPSLLIVIAEGTCDGFVDTQDSVNTQPGGTSATVTANSSGDYSYSFDAALTAGDVVAVTASDAGGTSEPLVLEANATPPTVGTPVIGDSDTITGTGATPAAKILVFDGDDEIGDEAIVGGGGNYTCNLDYKVIRGETVQVVAVVAGNEDVRSAPAFLTFPDLNLQVPAFTRQSNLYTGTTPVGATSIRIRKVLDSSETTATLVVTNGTFVFTLPDNPPGTAFDVYARYATGDSDPVRIFTPYTPVRAPLVGLELGYLRDYYNGDDIGGYVVDAPYLYGMKVSILDWVSGMDLTISFPGSAVADIVLSNIPDLTHVYAPYPQEGGINSVSYTIGGDQNYARYIKTIPLDTSGAYPVPYPVVVITATYPDGQTAVTTFDRETFTNSSFKDANWIFSKFDSTAANDYWSDYYSSLYPPP